MAKRTKTSDPKKAPPKKEATPPKVEPVPPPRCAICNSILPDIGTPVKDERGIFLRFTWTIGPCTKCEEVRKRDFFLSAGGVYKLNGDLVEDVVEVDEATAEGCRFTQRFLKLGEPGEETICAVFEDRTGARYAQPVEL